MARRPVCPKCRKTVDTAKSHCPDFRCSWAIHSCGELLDLRHPDRHTPYDPRATKERPS